MTEKEKMIPLSVIDAKIATIENDLKQEEKLGQYESKTIHSQLVGMFMILQEIKKEAIPSPSELEGGLHCPVCHFDYSKQKRTKTMEQKILQRIKEVEPMTGEWSKKQFIDELRKLLE